MENDHSAELAAADNDTTVVPTDVAPHVEILERDLSTVRSYARSNADDEDGPYWQSKADALEVAIAALCCGDGVRLIAAERARQQAKEGYTAASDDRYTTSALALAGASYALHAAGRTDARNYWPFDEEWWKPSAGNPIRDLVKAGALIAAEIDRIERLVGSHGNQVLSEASGPAQSAAQK